MECHQVFISGYDMFTQLQCLKNIFLRAGDAAHHFDDHINFRITDEFPWICSDFGGIDFDITRLIGILYSNAFDNNRRAHLTAQILLISFNDTDHARTDCPQPQ
ncbi:hypothetical protein D3C80_1826380 [compost metagenome]